MKYPDIFNSEISRVGVQESQMYNVIAGRLMAETVSSSLGPRGMEKVYIDILGESTITSHGGAFLRKLDVDHPSAKAVVDAVNTVDNHVGDGTVSAAVLIGALLARARDLLRMGIPTAAVTRGFEIGAEIALEVLNGIRIKSDGTDRRMMCSVVDSCLGGKAISHLLADAQDVRDIIIEAVLCVFDAADRTVRTDDIKIEEKPGNSADTQLIRGTVVDKPIDSPEMPRAAEDVRVLLLNDPLETMRTRTESEIEISSPEQMGAFLRQEESDLLSLVRRVAESGAGIVVSRKGISELAQQRLAEAGILSVRRAKYNDLWWLERSTGASTCRDIEEISEAELGRATRVYERTVGGDRMLFVEAAEPRSVTLLLRANSKTHLDEFHRTAKNAIFALRNFIEEPYVVLGGGSCEAILAREVRRRAASVTGREQMAAEGFADALEGIPITLAGNVGISALDALPQLRAACSAAGGGEWYGINSATRRIEEMSSSGIVETAVVKEQVIRTATEAVNMILNVDDVFMKELIDNTHCHIDGTVHAHKDPGRNHNHWEQEGLEQRQSHHYY